jgi:predicted PurR-regulated permease PerM
LRGDIVFAFALALACGLAWLVRDVLLLLYVSALFAVVLTPVVRFTSDIRIWRWQPFKGIGGSCPDAGSGAALTAFGFLALPPVMTDLQQFSGEADLQGCRRLWPS